MRPVIAIVGRPNVGKSTLFNRLIGRRSALVDPTPGVTRDRREGLARLGALTFTAIDTAGLEEISNSALEADMQAQTCRAIEEADAALLLFDARAGITPLDRYFADLMRRAHATIILVANKCEARTADVGRIEAYELGLGEPIAIASEHGIGMPDLEDAIAAALEKSGRQKRRLANQNRSDLNETDRGGLDGHLQLAIVGRPNVGKSTLINALVGNQRVITGVQAGTTRDSISIDWDWHGIPIKLIDTAGLRRKSKVNERVEKLSVGDALEAIRFAHVAVLVLDGTMMLDKQDLIIARHIIDEGRAIVIVVNKWDAVRTRQEALKWLYDRMEISLPQIRGVSVVTLSALTSHGLKKLLPEVAAVHAIWNKRISTGPLNRWLREAVDRHPPPISRGRPIRIRYITQSKARPPTFAVFASQPRGVPEAYVRYLINGIRERFDFPGVPLRISLRRARNPFAPSSGDL